MLKNKIFLVPCESCPPQTRSGSRPGALTGRPAKLGGAEPINCSAARLPASDNLLGHSRTHCDVLGPAAHTSKQEAQDSELRPVVSK